MPLMCKAFKITSLFTLKCQINVFSALSLFALLFCSLIWKKLEQLDCSTNNSNMVNFWICTFSYISSILYTRSLVASWNITLETVSGKRIHYLWDFGNVVVFLQQERCTIDLNLNTETTTKVGKEAEGKPLIPSSSLISVVEPDPFLSQMTRAELMISHSSS